MLILAPENIISVLKEAIIIINRKTDQFALII